MAEDTISTILGSTPRMRGIWNMKPLLPALLRFNPAYAGNMEHEALVAGSAQVQPRVCGEYTKKIMK